MKEKPDLAPQDAARISSTGIDLTDTARSGSFMQRDDTVLFSRSLSDDLEMMSMREALESSAEAREHYGTAFAAVGRAFDREAHGGYFIRVKKGRKVSFPLQACLFLKAERFTQKVHNVIIVEEGASLFLITGCSSARSATEGFHFGTSEFFVKKGGYLSSTMIHSWKEDITVRPVGIAVVEEGARFVSNYVLLKPVKDVTMFPTAVLAGAGARASLNSLILSFPRTFQDIGSRVIFRANGTSAEIVSRVVSLGGRSISRGHLRAEAPGAKAHLECRGLVLSGEGYISAIPELETRYRDVDMSHEAAIGKISSDEIEYLTVRGMTRSQAQSVIIRGFMDVGILGLPEALRREIDSLEEKTLAASL